MTKEELDTACFIKANLENRDNSRIFGNIDSDIIPISESEIMSEVWNQVINNVTINNLFERSNWFYKHFIK